MHYLSVTFLIPLASSPSPSGIIRLSEGFHDRYPVEDYLDLFDLAAYQIQDHLTGNSSGTPSQRNIIIGTKCFSVYNECDVFLESLCISEMVAVNLI